MQIGKILARQPIKFILAESVALMLLIGVLNKHGGWDFSLFLFYGVPIFFVAWFCRLSIAIILAIASGAVWFWANAETHPYGTTYAYLWATVNRGVYFLFVAIGGVAMRQYRAESQARIETLVRTCELEQEIVRVSESEQMRIGQDLHDGLCQNLVAIEYAAACIRADLEGKYLPEAEKVEVIQKMLKDTVMEARDLARGIFPVLMDGEGLPMALQDLVQRTNHSPRVSVTFSASGESGFSNSEVAVHFYRIAQQALNNALTHAEAKNIAVSLEQTASCVWMCVADDGKGIEQGESRSRGMGMRTMAYRARLIGAELGVASAPESGTEVTCKLMFPHAEHYPSKDDQNYHR